MKTNMVVFLLACFICVFSTNAKQLSRYEMSYEFQFGDLSLWIKLGEGDSRLCDIGKIKRKEGKKACSTFNLSGKAFFTGNYMNSQDLIAKSGLYEDGEEPKLILDSDYFKRFRLNGNSYILNTQQGVHVTYSVLYQLILEDGNASLKKINSVPHGFNTIYKVPNGVIYIGYNFKDWIPWAVFFDGKNVFPLKYLGEPEELILRYPSDSEKEKN